MARTGCSPLYSVRAPQLASLARLELRWEMAKMGNDKSRTTSARVGCVMSLCGTETSDGGHPSDLQRGRSAAELSGQWPPMSIFGGFPVVLSSDQLN